MQMEARQRVEVGWGVASALVINALIKNDPINRVTRCRTHHIHFASHVQPAHPQRVTTEQQHVIEEAGASDGGERPGDDALQICNERWQPQAAAAAAAAAA